MKINHMAIVVPELDEAMGFWVEALGLPLDHVAEVPAEEVKVAFLPVGDSAIELIAPTTEDSGVAKYLAKRGAGMHHLCLEVDDIEAALARLKEAGVPLINETAQVNHEGNLYAFIHPKGTNGVLVELYELPKEG
ncbi:MAG TPA: methylmalonyl-CoA epimerase [Anaerolineae bacterium]|nr:methylmalonyl-CoA epimerase [Anaerolineae bacterium]